MARGAHSFLGMMANATTGATKRRKEPSGTVSIADLVQTFDLPTWEQIEELNQEYIYRSGVECAEDPGDEDARFNAEIAATDELFRSWYDAALCAVERLYEAHGLELVPVRPKGAPEDARCWDLRVVPATTWQDAAAKLRETINGAGPFHYATVAELIAATGGTARRSVLSHLHWIAQYPAVYGTTSAERLFQGAWS